MSWLARLRDWVDPYWRERRELERALRRDSLDHVDLRYVCPHDDPLCDKYGCPDDPNWKGDRA